MATSGEMRVRLSAALAALLLHVLALAAALVAGSIGGPPDEGQADHLTVIALESPRTRAPAPERKALARGIPQSVPAIPPRAALQVRVPGPAAPALAAVVAEAKTLLPPATPAEAPPPPPRAAARTDGLGVYAGQLWSHIAAHRPRRIRQGGTTVVRFRLAPSGALLSAEVAASSGNLNLDKIALRTVRQAAPMPPPPAGATGEQLMFTVPVEFRSGS